MAEIKIKRSNVPGKAPAVGDLVLGELAINTYDGKLFLKRNDGTDAIVEIGSNATVPASTMAPSTPKDNSLWWDSASGSLKIYYNDGSSSQWVDASSSEKSALAESSTAPSNVFLFAGTTIGSTETELFINGTLNNRLTVETGSSIYYTIDISCRRTDGTDFAAFTLKGMASNSGGAVQDIGSIYEIVVVRTDAGLSVDARADYSTGSVNIYVTGTANKSFTWAAQLTLVKA